MSGHGHSHAGPTKRRKKRSSNDFQVDENGEIVRDEVGHPLLGLEPESVKWKLVIVLI